MRNGSGKFDMAHTLATDLAFRNFDAALFADDALITNAFVFSAMAFPVLRRPENSFAEKAVSFGFLRSVIYRFGFKNLAVRPLPDFFGTAYTDLH